MSRRIGDAGLRIIRSYESLRLHAYLPTKHDVPTIGYGHTKDVELTDVCSIAQAEAWLREDCADAEEAVNFLVKSSLTQNQFDALVSFTFNVGRGALESSTLLKKLNAGDFVGAADEFRKWNKQAGKVLGGLIKRRERERELFLKPDAAL